MDEPLPAGWSIYDPDEIGVVERPIGHIECEADIDIVYTNNRQPLLRCGYCDSTIRTRTPIEALAWFHQHACADLVPNAILHRQTA